MPISKNFVLSSGFTCLISVCTHSYALTTINDANIGSYHSTGIDASSDDIEINVSNATAAPHIVKTSSGDILSAKNGHTLTINSTAPFIIQGTADNQVGLFAQTGRIHTLSDVEIHMKSGRGIYIPVGGTGDFNGKVTINITGDKSIGVIAYGSNSVIAGGRGNFTEDLNINMQGSESLGIVLQNANPTGVMPKLTFEKSVTLRMDGNDSIGIFTMDIAPGGTLNTSLLHFKNGLDIEMSSGTAIQNQLAHSRILIDGNSRIVAHNNSGNNPEAIVAMAGEVNVTGKTTIIGNVEAINQGMVNLNMATGSSLAGRLDNYTVTPLPPGFSGPGVINLDFQEAGSTWDMRGTGTSYVNTIQGNGGTLMMRVSGVSRDSDKLVVTDANGVSGEHYVLFQNDATQNTTGTETLTVIETQGGTGSFTALKKAELGGYEYDLRRNPANANQWQLFGTSGKAAVTPTANAAASFFNASYLLSYIDTQTLRQRMGELRGMPEQQGDFWMRGFEGRLNSFSVGQLHDFDMNYWGIQAGVDRALETSLKGMVYIGVMGGYTKGNADYWRGDGSLNDYHVGVYGTFVTDNGFYADATLKYVRMKNDFNVVDNSGRKIDGDMTSNGWAVSAEVGKRIDVGASGLTITPQLQVSYAHQGGGNVAASNGLKVDIGSYNSVLARVGGTLDYQLPNATNPTALYMGAHYVHEFSANTDYRLNGNRESHDFSGNWGEVSLGVTSQIASQHNLFAEFKYASGSRFDQTQLNVGYRFEF